MTLHIHGPLGAGDALRARVRQRGGSARILFVHGTIGTHLLADPRRDRLGGGLRARLEDEGHAVHQAFQGSVIGALTDRSDWIDKLGAHFDRLVRTAHQDTLLPDRQRNDIVVFKSCYRQNKFRPERTPARFGPTVARAKHELEALRDAYAAHPDTHFIWMTTPPFAPRDEGFVKRRARSLLGLDDASMGDRAWHLNAWTIDPNGWLAGYDAGNVSIFDYFSILTGGWRHGLLDYVGPIHDRPSNVGQQHAAAHFVRALRELLDAPA